MNFRTSSTVVVSILMLTSGALARGNYRDIWQNSESAIQSFKNVSKCTERIWPGYSWKGYSFLSVDNSKERQVAFDVDTQETYRISLKDLENSDGAYQSYDFFTSNGKEWVSVNESFVSGGGEPQALFALGAHEGFHHIGQKGWAHKEGSGARGTNIPVRWEPRYYRAKLFATLREAFLSPDKQSIALGKAAFWFNKWKTEFAEEVASVTDGYEGTAKYADHISKALAIKGCQASETQLLDYVSNAVRTSGTFADVASKGGFGSADFEGYPMGSVAAFILRWQNPIQGWESRVSSKAETPVEILLENVKPVADEILENETVIFKGFAEAQQKRVDALLGDTLNKLNEDYVVLSIPQSYKPGATRYQGFFNDTQTGNSFSVLPQTLMLQGKAGFFRTSEFAVQFSGQSFPCKEWGWQFVVGANEIKTSGGAGFVHSLKIVGQGKGSLKIASDQTKYFCVGE